MDLVCKISILLKIGKLDVLRISVAFNQIDHRGRIGEKHWSKLRPNLFHPSLSKECFLSTSTFEK